MNEHQLQHQCVLWFGQNYPERYGTLFSVNNEASNNRHAMKLKATGVIPGVSDLLYVEDGVLIGIELKTKGSRHKKDHIQQQYEWGCAIERAGGEYYIVRSLSAFQACINALSPEDNDDILTTSDIAKLLKTPNQSIKF